MAKSQVSGALRTGNAKSLQILSNSKKQISFFITAGIFQGLASLFPETVASLLLTWAALLSLCSGIRYGTERIYLSFFLFGLSFGLIAFYWLSYTIHFFGGFPWALAIFVFVLFLFFSSIQFLLCAWLYVRLSKSVLRRFHLPLALAWFVSETLFPRLFPWAIAHTQIVWTSFATLAEYGGVHALGFLMFFWAQLMLDFWFEREKHSHRFAAIVVFFSAALICFGLYRTQQIETIIETTPKFKAGLIQGNLDAREKGDIRLFDVNLERYRTLSQEALDKGAELLIWPETVVNEWFPENIRYVADTKFDPMPGAKAPLLFGALAYRLPEKNTSFLKSKQEISRFNSAIGVDEFRNLTGMYHKRVLMPFGEFIPLADRFPVLKELSPHTGDLQSGDLLEPIRFKLAGSGASREVAASTLICYEDLVPSLSIDAVSRGGNLLVNLTNDAWYGDTHAPYQHHLLASWRAVEMRRFLIRVTNTGFTGVVSPLGVTTASLPNFQPGLLVEEVGLLEERTLYSKTGESPSSILAWSLFVYAAIFLRNRARKPDGTLIGT